MIQTIHIKNFQAHQETRLDLHPGVNVITGQSDNGKSSIVRSLLWLFFNKSFSFEEIKRRGTAPKDWTEVTITIPGHTISRMRNRDVNKYVLDGQDLKAVGSNVPGEVLEVLPVSEVNAQSQMDSPFLLSNTPGEIAKTFNSLAGLQDIDISLSSVKSQIGQTRTKIASLADQKTRVEEQLTKYQDLDRIETLINTLDSLTRDINEIDQSEKTLTGYERQLVDCFHLIESYERAVEDKKRLEEIRNITVQIQKTDQDIQNLSRLGMSLDRCSKQAEMVPLLQSLGADVQNLLDIERKTSALEKAKEEFESCQRRASIGRDAEEDRQELSALQSLLQDAADLDQKSADLSRLGRERRSLAVRIDDKKKEEDSLRIQLDTLLKDLGICPLCGSQIV